MSLLMFWKSRVREGKAERERGMLWVISRFIFPGSSSRGESRVLQPPRCSFLFSLLHFIPLGDFLPLSPLLSSPFSPIRGRNG